MLAHAPAQPIYLTLHEPVYLTADGQAQIEEELHTLLTERRPGIVALVSAAAEDGDGVENVALIYTRQDLTLLEDRIVELQGYLRRAVLIEHAPEDRVTLGALVTVRDDGEEDTYTIVGPLEAAPAQGRISHQSPMGRALLGHMAGDQVPIETPTGTRLVTICAVV